MEIKELPLIKIKYKYKFQTPVFRPQQHLKVCSGKVNTSQQKKKKEKRKLNVVFLFLNYACF